jgi:hypothetical protein
MNDWKLVPAPENIKSLKKDKRGYPVPYTVMIDKKGIPQFRVNDERKPLNAVMCKSLPFFLFTSF